MANAHIKPLKISKSVLDKLDRAPKLYRVWDTEITGFHVRVAPTGLITFALRYHNNDRRLDFNIGRYGLITLTEARQRATRERARALTDNVDLLAEKRREKEAEIERIKAEKRGDISSLGGFYTKKYLPWVESTFRKKGMYDLKRIMEKEFKYLMDYKLEEITPHVVDQYLQKTKLKQSHLKPSTINRRIVILKALLNKAVTWDFLDKSRLAGYKMLKVDKQPITRVLSQEEEKALRAALEQRQQTMREERVSYNKWAKQRSYELKPVLSQHFTDYVYPIVLTALNTGMRKGEIFNLTWENVNFNTRMLTVVGASSKSGNTRVIPMNDETFKVLKKWQAQTTNTGLVFPSKVTNERLDNIDQAWHSVLSDAKINDLRFHDLRHTFASMLVRSGADLNTVRELMGHSSLEMTLRYSHTNMDSKKSAVRILDNLREQDSVNKKSIGKKKA